MTDELEGQEVRSETDPEADRRGSYGRLLVYLYTDGTNFNRELIDQGLARMYDSKFSKRGEYESTEAQAQQVLENTPGDPSGLDGDDNGVACESLP